MLAGQAALIALAVRSNVQLHTQARRHISSNKCTRRTLQICFTTKTQ
jgi:hypothetical protein